MSNAALAYSVPEAAARIGISRSGLYVLIARREIPIAKIGSRTLVLDADLRAYLAAQRAASSAASSGRRAPQSDNARGE